MSIDAAIALLDAEVQGLQPTPARAATPAWAGSSDWFLLRAKSLGLSSLRRMKQLGVDVDPPASERFHRTAEKYLVADPLIETAALTAPAKAGV